MNLLEAFPKAIQCLIPEAGVPIGSRMLQDPTSRVSCVLFSPVNCYREPRLFGDILQVLMCNSNAFGREFRHKT